MDWQFWVPNLIALVAIGVAWVKRQDTKRYSRHNIELQKRLEEYEHHPLVTVVVEPDGAQVRVTLINTSPSNAVSSYEIRLVLRVTAANGSLRIDKSNSVYRGRFLAPNSTAYIYPEDINQLVAYALPALCDQSSDNDHFVLRAIVECVPPHPKSPTFTEQGVGYFLCEHGRLKLRASTNGIQE